MGNILTKADQPVIGVPRTASVMDAVRIMVQKKIGAVVILENDRALGIFSERDLMTRVVLDRLDPEKTPIHQVMTAPVLTIVADTPHHDALKLMSDRHIRHLPVADASGRVLGMLSIRNLMSEEIDDLKNSVETLEAYASYDGASG